MSQVEELLQPLADSGIFGPLLQNEYGVFVFVVLMFTAIGGIFHFVLKGFFKGLTRKTKTDIDDRIFDMIKMPIFALINIYGVFLALSTLSALAGYIAIIEGGFFVASTVIASVVMSKVLSLIVGRLISDGEAGKKAPRLVMMLVNIVIYLAALLVILDHFGVDITAGIAALGVGGIAIGLALQGTLRDFFSGLHIVTDKPVNVGDYIEVPEAGIEGYVLDVGWRSTKIRALPDNVVFVPNSRLADSVIVNDYMQNREIGFVVDCGVAYDSDLDKVEKVALEVARDVQQNVPGAVKAFAPLLRFKEFGDSNINFYVVLRVDEFTQKYPVKSEFIKSLKRRFDEEGIEISWPVRKIYYGEGGAKKK